MKVIKTEIENVLIFEPAIFEDDRGFFMKAITKKSLQSSLALLRILYRIIILNRFKG